MPSRYLSSAMPAPRVQASERTGPDPTFLEAAGASFRTSIDEQDIPQERRLNQAYGPIEDALIDMGYDRSTLRPRTDHPVYVAGVSTDLNPLNGAALWEAVNTARARDPKAFASLPGTREEFERGVLTRNGTRRTDQATTARGGFLPQLAGGAVASFADPVNIATLPLGGGAKTIAQTILREAVVNMATEAFEQPMLADAKKRLGETLTVGEAGLNVATAGVAGGVLGGVGKAVELHAGAVGGRIADAREATIAGMWDRLPEAVRKRWADASKVTEADMPDLVEMTLGRDGMSEDVRAAAGLVRQDAAIARSNPFVANGAGVAANQENLADAMARILSDTRQAPARPALNSSTAITGGTVAPRVSRGGADAAFEALVVQESRGRRGVPGPMTQYGQAHGLTQVLDTTAAALAKRLGMPWQPELMRGTSDAAAAYQLKIGRAYFDEGLARYNGDLRQALMFYHGGPDKRIWGPKTRAYADEVMARAGGRVELAPEVAVRPDRAAIQADLDRLRGERFEMQQAARDDVPNEAWEADPAMARLDDAEIVPARMAAEAATTPAAYLDQFATPVRPRDYMAPADGGRSMGSALIDPDGRIHVLTLGERGHADEVSHADFGSAVSPEDAAGYAAITSYGDEYALRRAAMPTVAQERTIASLQGRAKQSGKSVTEGGLNGDVGVAYPLLDRGVDVVDGVPIETRSTYLMDKFWDNQRSRGVTPSGVWAMRSTGGDIATQPKGYVQGWSVNRGDVARMIDRTAGDWEMVRMRPPEAVSADRAPATAAATFVDPDAAAAMLQANSLTHDLRMKADAGDGEAGALLDALDAEAADIDIVRNCL